MDKSSEEAVEEFIDGSEQDDVNVLHHAIDSQPESNRHQPQNVPVTEADCDVSRQAQEWHSLTQVCAPTCEKESVTSVIEESENAGVLVPPKRTCISLAVSMLLLAICFNANQNLQSSINGKLGVISLGIVYVFILLAAPLAPACVELVGGKIIVIISCVAHAIYIVGHFYPSLGTLVPASVIIGITAGALGTSQGLYLSAAGKSYLIAHKMDKSRLHSVLSLINGFYFMCVQSSQILGNLVSSLVLSTSTYNQTLLENNTCGASLCPSDLEGKSATIEAPDQRSVNILLGVLLVCPVVATLIVIFLLPRLPNNMSKDPGSSRWKHLTSCVRMVATPKCALLIPLYMAQAMGVMNIFTGYTQGFISCTIGVRWLGYALTSFGICAAAFAVIANSMARHLGRIPLFIFFILTDISLIVTMLVWQPSQHQGVVVFFIIPALAGISEGTCQPQFNAMIATVFKDNEPPAFATYHFFKCVAFSLFLIVSGITCFNHRLYFTLSLYIVALCGYIAMEILHKRKQQHSS